MIVLVNKSGIKVGYLLGSYKLEYCYRDYLLNRNLTDTSFRRYIGRYKSVLFSQDLDKRIKSLQGVSDLRDVFLLKCSLKDLGRYFKSEFRYISEYIDDSVYTYYIILDNVLNPLGYVVSRNVLYTDDIFEVSMIKVVQNHQGVGSSVIRYLKSLGKRITGYSLVGALGFWQKCDAVFMDDYRFYI